MTHSDELAPALDPDDPIGSVFAPLVGLSAWNVQKGQGSFLTFDFGEPHLYVREPVSPSFGVSETIARRLRQRRVIPRGDWYLWIYCCQWTCFEGETPIASDESNQEEINLAARFLDGQRLIGVELSKADKSVSFCFDLGGRLETAPYADGSNDEQWLLYTPSGFVFSFRDDGRYSWARGDQSEAGEIWRPL